jgi:hypothetical protein
LALLCVVPACDTSGVKLAKVKGHVTYKGAPLKGASVKFYPEKGPMAIGMTDDSGDFTLTTNGRPGATIGSHKVAITKVSGPAGPAMPANPSPEDMMKMQKAQMNKPSRPKSEIPESYGAPESSKLSAEVSANAAENEFEFPLQ